MNGSVVIPDLKAMVPFVASSGWDLGLLAKLVAEASAAAIASALAGCASERKNEPASSVHEPEALPVPTPEPVRIPDVPASEPTVRIPDVPAPEPVRIPDADPAPILAPEPVREEEPVISHLLRTREPAAYGFANLKLCSPRVSSEAEEIHEHKHDCAISTPAKRARHGNFETYQRPKFGLEEVDEFFAPKEEITLDPKVEYKKADAEERILMRGRQYGVDTSKQGIKKRRLEISTAQSNLNYHTLEIAKIQRLLVDAEQEEKVFIWAESLRQMAAK